jgi:hypothetical protein
VASQRETKKGHPGGSAKGERRRPWPRDLRLAAASTVMDQGFSAHTVARRSNALTRFSGTTNSSVDQA